jgi:hypothetical protein
VNAASAAAAAAAANPALARASMPSLAVPGGSLTGVAELAPGDINVGTVVVS